MRVRKDPYLDYEESITLRAGIPVLRALGSPPPVLRAPAESGYAVQFEADADANTIFDGFSVEGGTAAVVRLRGAGSVSDCAITSGAAGTPIGILAEGATGSVTDCTVTIPTATPGARGIRLAGSSVTVQDCEVRVPSSTPPSRGIDCESGASSVRRTLVVGPDTGIWSQDSTVVEWCTVDQAGEGIRFSEDPPTHSIASGCGTAGFVKDGGEPLATAMWCIADEASGYGPGSQGAGSVVEDPLYCDAANGIYTLRADSYGAGNNEMGVGIGAFPRACLLGTLQRDVALLGESLPVAGPVIVPEGRLLTLTQGAGLAFAPGSGITVHGSFNVGGYPPATSVLEGTDPTPGSWSGISVGGPAARVTLAECTVQHATTCVSATNDTAAALIRLGPSVTLEDFSLAGIYLRPQAVVGTPRVELQTVAVSADVSDSFAVLIDRRALNGTYQVHMDNNCAFSGGMTGLFLGGPALPGADVDTLAGVFLLGSGTLGADLRHCVVDWSGGALGPKTTGVALRDTTTALIHDGATLITGAVTGVVSDATSELELRNFALQDCDVGLDLSGPAVVDGCTIWESTAGPAGRVGIVVRGESQIGNSTLTFDKGSPGGVVGIRAVGASGTVSDCSVTIETSTGPVRGFDLQASALLVEDCAVRLTGAASPGYGIVTFNGASTLDTCLTVGGDNGIWVADTTLIAHSTVDSTLYDGILCGPEATVRNTIATNVSLGDPYSPDYKSIRCGAAYYCIAPRGIFTMQVQEGCSTEDPLYCDAAAKTLRVDSYGNPANNPSGELIGALPVACASGVLQGNATYAGAGVLAVPDTLIVPEGLSLLLEAGTTLRVGPGTSIEKIEVHGSLVLAGTEADPVVIESAAASPAEGDWYGIEVNPGATVTLDYAEIRHAVYGVVLTADGGDTVRFSDFSMNQVADISVTRTTWGGARLDQNTIAVGGGSGIRLQGSGQGISVVGNILTGSGSAAEGIHTQGAVSDSLTANTITGCGNGEGIHIASGAPVLTQNVISGCKYGVLVESGIAAIGTDATDSDNVITGGTNGIRVIGASAIPRIRNNHVHQNDTGVMARTSGRPDLGTGAGDPGNNSLEGNTLNCIKNTTAGVTVLAHGNWYGSPAPPTCAGGNVITLDYLLSGPLSTRRRPEVVAMPTPLATTLQVRGAWPNPTQGGTDIAFTLDGTGAVGVEVFDVSGRLVRVLDRGRYGPGEQRLKWDGLDGSGRSVGTGIYFVRVTGNETLHGTVKVLVAR